MRGIKFLSTTALAASKGGFESNKQITSRIEGIQPPLGRREAFQSMILGTAVLAPTIVNALDMDAFMNAEVRR